METETMGSGIGAHTHLDMQPRADGTLKDCVRVRSTVYVYTICTIAAIPTVAEQPDDGRSRALMKTREEIMSHIEASHFVHHHAHARPCFSERTLHGRFYFSSSRAMRASKSPKLLQLFHSRYIV